MKLSLFGLINLGDVGGESERVQQAEKPAALRRRLEEYEILAANGIPGADNMAKRVRNLLFTYRNQPDS